MADEVTIVDAHVHVHPGTVAESLLDAAVANFAGVAARIGAVRSRCVLMLAEMNGTDWFDAMHRPSARAGRWMLEPLVGDAAALTARAAGAELTIIAGRQIVTTEGVEVLALATRAKLKDGMTLEETITAAHSQEAIVVLPWGAGKWLGPRGRLVADAAREHQHAVFLGDNGGRPSFWPEPHAFAAQKNRGRPILSGTDPLPLPRDENRVGSFGFWFRGHSVAAAPSRSLRERLSAATPDGIVAFGRLQGPLQFLNNQIALRLRKRAGHPIA